MTLDPRSFSHFFLQVKKAERGLGTRLGKGCRAKKGSSLIDPRPNPPASFRLIACFALEIARFACDHATTIENEKLWSKGVAMYAYSVSIYYV